MSKSRPGARHRAILVAVALYGLLVQALLGGFGLATPALSRPAGILCTHDTQDEPGAPTPDHGHVCCLAACAVGASAAPVLPSVGTAAAWPARRATRLAWRPEPVLPGARRASSIHSARGPPAV